LFPQSFQRNKQKIRPDIENHFKRHKKTLDYTQQMSLNLAQAFEAKSPYTISG